jgi:SAM-dependent methyltransferase
MPNTVVPAGYDRAELAGLSANASVDACGCGSPVAASDMQPGDVVLDLGCGTGLDLLLAAKKVGPKGRVVGVDMTAAMLDRARATVTEAGLHNVHLRKGIIEDLPVGDQSVDWVISNCVINLSRNKLRVFDEIARVLKPGGRMRVADIVAEDLPDWIRRRDDLYNACVAGAISEADYVVGLRRAGLTDVSVGNRYVYDKQQLGSLIVGEAASSTEANLVADALVGRVWSLSISAGKKRNEGTLLMITNEEVTL